jgi:hypothetical protein
MPCTEAYKEHIEYTFNAFCRVVIYYAAINAWRDRDRRRQWKISFGKRIRIAAIENGHIDRDTEDSIRQRLVAALFKFRFDEQEV